MFGLPPGNALREVVVELTRDHTRTVSGILGTEPPLLRLLEVAIKSNTSGGAGGSGRNKNSAPLDVTALALWDSIYRKVGEHWPGRSDPSRKSTHLMDRLTAWTNVVAGGENEPHLLEYCTYWRNQIRELLEPAQRIPLRGVSCMGCKEAWVVDETEDGRVIVPALMASISERHQHGVEVACMSCNERFSGLGLQLLAS